jgi:DNA-binding PadR family transcriptional regulator
MQQEVVLALLAKEPSHGYELRARIERALGPLAEGFNAGQMYVTLGRLEQAGLVTSVREARTEGAERRTYELTAPGRQRVEEWLVDNAWPRPDLTNFHLKLVVAAAGRLADPMALIDAQRQELVRRLRDAQRAAMAEPVDSDAALLLEGVVLRIEADLTWLDACERAWSEGR